VNASRKFIGRAIRAPYSQYLLVVPALAAGLHMLARGRRPHGIIGRTVGTRRLCRLDRRTVMTRGGTSPKMHGVSFCFGGLRCKNSGGQNAQL
jgi:hypothetical protein